MKYMENSISYIIIYSFFKIFKMKNIYWTLPLINFYNSKLHKKTLSVHCNHETILNDPQKH